MKISQNILHANLNQSISLQLHKKIHLIYILLDTYTRIPQKSSKTTTNTYWVVEEYFQNNPRVCQDCDRIIEGLKYNIPQQIYMT